MNSSGRDIFKKFGVYINAVTRIIALFPLRFRMKSLVLFRGIKGRKGNLIRYLLLKTIAKECGTNVVIMEDVYLLNPQNLRMGSNISIHPMSYIQAGEKGIYIQSNVSIAHGVTIIAESHTFASDELPIKYQSITSEPITIKENVWIGAKCIILMGITINSGTVIGANSVVTHNISENIVAAGNPCREIRKRNIYK